MILYFTAIGDIATKIYHNLVPVFSDNVIDLMVNRWRQEFLNPFTTACLIYETSHVLVVGPHISKVCETQPSDGKLIGIY